MGPLIIEFSPASFFYAGWEEIQGFALRVCYRGLFRVKGYRDNGKEDGNYDNAVT